MALKITFTLKAETKTCYRFETGEKPDQMTLYLKKAQVDAAGIDPHKGITVTVEEGCK
jgi:hypothetical protein